MFALISTPLPAQTPALEEVGVLRLEETERHLVVRPNLVPDPLGGWIYWDSELNEARLFDADGRLTVAFGRPGEGPGEFERLVGVVRVDDGRLVTLDGRGRVGIWSPSGDSLIHDFRSDVTGARSLVATGPGRVLASTPGVIRGRIEESAPLLHSIDVDRRESEVSAYLPPSDPAWAPVLAAVTAPGPVRRGALLHVAAAPHDSIWTLSLPSLTRRSAIGVGVQRLRLDPPPAEAIQGRRAWFEWVAEAWFVGRFAPLRDGDWLVQTWAVRPSGGRDRTLHRLDPNGTVRQEIDDDRVLLAVDPDSDHLLLWSELHPAEVIVARFPDHTEVSTDRWRPSGIGQARHEAHTCERRRGLFVAGMALWGGGFGLLMTRLVLSAANDGQGPTIGQYLVGFSVGGFAGGGTAVLSCAVITGNWW